jgi:hypothetical protein
MAGRRPWRLRRLPVLQEAQRPALQQGCWQKQSWSLAL